MQRYGDFTGFTLGGIHSSNLNILRISDGSRYNENLLPTFQDKTVQIPGGDGTYYFYSNYTQRQISINIAYDSMTEQNMRELRQLLGTKDFLTLKFDETPYKEYIVRPQGQPQLKYICFDTPDGQRVYKGEGTIQLIAYFPFAKSIYKFLNESTDSNKDEWSNSNVLPTSATYATNSSYNEFYNVSSQKITRVINTGDLDTDFILTFTLDTTKTQFDLGQIQINEVGNSKFYGNLKFNTIPTTALPSDAAKIYIDSKTELIGVLDTNDSITDTLLNGYLDIGDFFKIKTGESTITISNNLNTTPTQIDYKYLYY